MVIKSSILFGIVAIIATIIGTYLLSFEWMVFLFFALGSLSKIKRWKLFAFGAFIPSIVWMTIVLLRDMRYERSVAELVANILGNIPPFAVIVLVGLTVGLVSGFSVVSGNLIRSIIVKDYK